MRRPGLYADIPVPVLQVPAGVEEGPGGLPNLLKVKEKVDNENKKKEDVDYEGEMEGMRRDEKEMQDSLVVEEGMIVKFPWLFLPLVLVLLTLQLLLLSRRS